MKIALVASTDRALALACELQADYVHSRVYSTRVSDAHTGEDVVRIASVAELLGSAFHEWDAWVFIGALGVCVRSIAPHLTDKRSDPAVVNLDEEGRHVQSVLSGHLGGANELTLRISRRLGAEAVITTSSDVQGLWALDLLASAHGWTAYSETPLNELISLFVNRRATALLLEGRDKGTDYLERTCPPHVTVYQHAESIDFGRHELLLVVGPRIHKARIPVLHYHPRVLVAGIGCTKDLDSEDMREALLGELENQGLAGSSVASLVTAGIKAREPALLRLSRFLSTPISIVDDSTLRAQEVPFPSTVVQERVGVPSVAEAAALAVSGAGQLLLPKKRLSLPSGHMTLALAVKQGWERRGRISIVGAGPGDPELISVRGQQLLREADFILYAGSLVPLALTEVAKPGAEVRSSAGMDLPAQIAAMARHYECGHQIVRLHTGDPCLYGAIQEQMAEFDARGWDYHIVPGISAFQAAAAALRSQFTLPEGVQTIILTRDEGATPMPEREKLSDLARHRATLCIYLSIALVESVERQLLEHYPASTPLALLHRISWPDERIVVGTVADLVRLTRVHEFTRTTLIVVGDAIGARRGRSHLYDPAKSHGFRRASEEERS